MTKPSRKCASKANPKRRLLLKPGLRPWTRTLDPDPEKPGLRKTWTLKNLDSEKPGP